MDAKLPITRSACYHPEWDRTPEAYLQAQIVQPTRSRRLGRYGDPLRQRKGYIGVYHLADRLGTEGRTRFFLSLFAYGNPLGRRSYSTIHEVLRVLKAFHGWDEPWEAFL